MKKTSRRVDLHCSIVVIDSSIPKAPAHLVAYNSASQSLCEKIGCFFYMTKSIYKCGCGIETMIFQICFHLGVLLLCHIFLATKIEPCIVFGIDDDLFAPSWVVSGCGS